MMFVHCVAAIRIRKYTPQNQIRQGLWFVALQRFGHLK